MIYRFPSQTPSASPSEYEGADWILAVLLVLAVPFLLYLFTGEGDVSGPRATTPKPTGPQDKPWTPTVDSRLSKVVWGYE